MSHAGWSYDVCVVGLGRVGLPLALTLAERGLRVVGVERDAALRDAVNSGTMPFREPGYEPILEQRAVAAHEEMAVASGSRHVVVTVGTPLRANIEADTRQIHAAIEALAPHLRRGQLFALRSTVSPRTTRMVARRLERTTGLEVGEDLGVAFCPERTAEGRARRELSELPQIVGADDELSLHMARDLFAVMAPDVLCTTSINAELLKLFTNIERYVHFSVANQFALVADTLGGNIHEIRRLANDRYPREHIASPGLTGGACLRKDFGMIDEWNPYVGLSTAAWRINESMPMFLVQHMLRRIPLVDTQVAVLGYSFKAGSDDMRDSLTPKLLRYVERECPAEVRVNDPYLPDPIVDPDHDAVPNHALEACLDGADAVFVAIDHAPYGAALRSFAQLMPDAWVADLWNCGGNDELFYQLGDLEPGP